MRNGAKIKPHILHIFYSAAAASLSLCAIVSQPVDLSPQSMCSQATITPRCVRSEDKLKEAEGPALLNLIKRASISGLSSLSNMLCEPHTCVC